MSTVQEPMIVTPTKCVVKKPDGSECGHIFKADLLRDATIIGQSPEMKMRQVQALVYPMIQHLQIHHPEYFKWTQVCGGELAGYLAFLGFDMDQKTRTMLNGDRTRWKIRQMMTLQSTRDRTIDDEIDQRLRAVLDKWAPAHVPELFYELFQVMKNLRDVLLENGLYPRAGEAPTASQPENGPNSGSQ